MFWLLIWIGVVLGFIVHSHHTKTTLQTLVAAGAAGFALMVSIGVGLPRGILVNAVLLVITIRAFGIMRRNGWPLFP